MAPQLAQDLGRHYGGNEYGDTHQTAERAGISASFLNKARVTGDGPPFVKIGKAVRYHWPAVEAWLQTRVRRSTSEQVAA